MYILIGSIVAFFALSAAAPLPGNSAVGTDSRRGRRMPGNARISPTSLSDEARYDTWLCVRE
jgi:hypothetical protein